MKLCVKLLWISALLNGTFSLLISSIKQTRNNNPGKCDPSVRGNTVVIVDKDGDDRILICVRRNGKYSWRDMENFPSVETLGDHFNPAEDCSNIVRKNRDAKSGYFWVRPFGMNQARKVWCDVTTDGGGFMLVGHMGSPVSWTVPSNDIPVSPQGTPHWSSAFGNVSMLEFRIQVLTTKNLKASEADWLYRFTTPRRLTELLISDDGGCTKSYPGVGHIEHVKDLLTGKVTTETFTCSQFGHSYRSELGWKLMNKCLGKACKGFGVFPGTQTQYDNFGAFSYSTNAKRSGISQNSTAFVGCEHGKCCACFGPKGAKGDFCSPRCNKINGGIVTSSAQVWFWIRSSIPKRPTWTKCMEYDVQTTDGKTETHFLDENSGIAQKGSCSEIGVPNIVDGVVKVANKAGMDNLPPVQGLMSYRKDNAKLYVTDGQGWEALGKEKQEKALENKLNLEERKILNIAAEFRKENTELKNRLEALENILKINGIKLGKSCKEILLNDPAATSGVYWIDPLGGLSHHREFQVYCDMETRGGGWTLVYSYTFTNYNNFDSVSNAVTPRPNWPASFADVPVSTSPPLDELSRGAVNFTLWKEIGKKFLIKSNINDWIVCLPNNGSMVTEKTGKINCQNIKNVATTCQGKSPTKITWHQYGPYLSSPPSNIFYDFVQSISGDWPCHDPCGTRKKNEKRNVRNPGGAIFLR